MQRASCLAPAGRASCHIGQISFDGFGHQLESKMMCIAAAMHLGLRYVHVPFQGKAHGESAEEPENLMGFSLAYPSFNRSSMHHVRRKPSSAATWPFARPCRYCLNRANLTSTCASTHYTPSWLRKVETNASFRQAVCCADSRGRTPVFTADNCYDFFSCHVDWPQLWLQRARPAIRQLYSAVMKPSESWHTHALQQAWGAKVAIHVRLGDVAERALPVGYYARAVRALRVELLHTVPVGGGACGAPFFRVQSNGRLEDVALMSREGLNGSDVVFDLSRYSNVAAEDRTSLSVAYHRLVSADALVMSRSALSMAAALISRGLVLFPRCWQEYRRPLPEWRMWDCCEKADELPKGGNCFSEGRRKRWKETHKKHGAVFMG